MVKEKDKQILMYYIFLQYIKQMYIAQFLFANNDIELEHDANGNVILYGDREFTWTYGRSLASVLDGMDEYTYTYDENGIRTSKTVDDVTTYYNTKDGVILSQTDGENTWYFQYDTSGTPLGFVLNGTQYFYITNQMNDVLAITDTNGDIVGNYEYDAWGKVLTADTDLAKQNPLRYRGYYYDNETGYYYLQSRYYDSNICRFINSDIAEISQMAKDVPVGTNLIAYCNNDSVNNVDYEGYRKTPNWVIVADKGISMAIPSNSIRYMKIKQRSYSIFKKALVYSVYQYYSTRRIFYNESYEMYTYGATRTQWYKLIDNFKAGLKRLGYSSKIISSSTFAQLAAKVIKQSVKKVNLLLSIAGFVYDFLVQIAEGVLDKIEKNIRNISKNSYYVFNLYVIYTSSTWFTYNRNLYYAYTPGVGLLYGRA